MASKQQDGPQANQEKNGRTLREAVVGNNVARALGPPEEGRQVQVRELWGRHYRVNILIRADAANTRIAHSYFLVSDDEGNVVESTPPITKHD
jgi:hypothetical protein